MFFHFPAVALHIADLFRYTLLIKFESSIVPELFFNLDRATSSFSIFAIRRDSRTNITIYIEKNRSFVIVSLANRRQRMAFIF